MWCNSSAHKVKIMCRNFPLQFNVICICRNTQDHSIFTAALATILPNLGGPKHSQRLVTKVMRSILQSASFTRWRRLETWVGSLYDISTRLVAPFLFCAAAPGVSGDPFFNHPLPFSDYYITCHNPQWSCPPFLMGYPLSPPYQHVHGYLIRTLTKFFIFYCSLAIRVDGSKSKQSTYNNPFRAR